jgi:hypothetical protein
MGLGILIEPKKKPGEEPDEDMPESDDGDDSPESMYVTAGKAIRHALADKDDMSLGKAVCNLMDWHSSKEPGADEGDDEPSAPDLASILSSSKKK